MNNNNYYTLKGYAMLEDKKITYAMEDYLEMICRICTEKDLVRISEISVSLNVRQSSVSKMVNNLKALGLVSFEKYGFVKPTVQGAELGNYLIYRHNVLNQFFCFINKTDNELEIVEKIEHFLDERTVINIEKYLKSLTLHK